jgi:RNA polymerase sigma-70 factor (ECF subfamily)
MSWWKTGKAPGGPVEPPAADRPEDEEIRAAVRAVQGGAGPDAFGLIFRRFYRPLRNFFANQSTLRDEADDLAQATLFKAYENIGQYRFEAPFHAWLRQIGENVWRNALREGKAAKRGSGTVSLETAVRSGEGEPLPVDVADARPTPEQEALAGEKVRVLRAAIEALPPGMRQMTEMRLFADLKYREIAEATGSGLNTVRSQLFEARKRLKPVLDEYFQGAEF